MAKNTIPDGENVKYWILPDGTVVNLGRDWHFQYILKNFNKLKKFKLKKSEMGDAKTEGPVRLYALSKGFTRMNFSINGSKLTIEASERGWGKKTKDAIWDFVADNVDRIDAIYVAVMEVNYDKGGDSHVIMKKKKDVSWWNMDSEEKLTSIPYVESIDNKMEQFAQLTERFTPEK